MALLPRFVSFKSIYNNKYLQWKFLDEEGEPVHDFNQFSGENPVSPYAKYEIELAKTGDGLVHIRSCYNNKYFVRWSPRHWWIVAAADEPDEDKSYWSCTLFEPIFIARHKTFRLRHVQLNHYACLWRLGSKSNKDCCLFAGSESVDKMGCDVFTIIDWEDEIDLQSPAPNPPLSSDSFAMPESSSTSYQSYSLSTHEGDNAAMPLPKELCHLFSLAEILSVTHNFDKSLVIGKGGFGEVYKAVIENGASDVAIKRLSSTSKQGDSEFKKEIEMLSKCRHSHIVSLVGYCVDSSEKIIVYEYMVNGSLADHLYKIGKHGSGSTILSWVQRLKICLGAARGLDYLHTGTGLQDGVIHRDVKSSNILLDKNWAAKVSDFGLSRISPVDQSCTHVSTNVKGTMGYIDPAYRETYRLTMKSDVYSFGVVLFEVLCGRQAVDFRFDDEQRSLARWAQHCIEKGTLHRIVDSNLSWEILPESLAEFARIANQCLLYQSKKRPTMTQVVASLELALTLQLGHKDYSAFEMEMYCTSEANENPKKVDSTAVQEEAIKIEGVDILQSSVKPTKKKALTKILQLFMCGQFTGHQVKL